MLDFTWRKGLAGLGSKNPIYTLKVNQVDLFCLSTSSGSRHRVFTWTNKKIARSLVVHPQLMKWICSCYQWISLHFVTCVLKGISKYRWLHYWSFWYSYTVFVISFLGFPTTTFMWGDGVRELSRVPVSAQQWIHLCMNERRCICACILFW